MFPEILYVAVFLMMLEAESGISQLGPKRTKGPN